MLGQSLKLSAQLVLLVATGRLASPLRAKSLPEFVVYKVHIMLPLINVKEYSSYAYLYRTHGRIAEAKIIHANNHLQKSYRASSLSAKVSLICSSFTFSAVQK